MEKNTDAVQTLAERFNSVPIFDIGNIKYRDQKKRYPWWVKAVDKITTEIDDSQLKKSDYHSIIYAALFESEKVNENAEKSQTVVAKGIKENILCQQSR